MRRSLWFAAAVGAACLPMFAQAQPSMSVDQILAGIAANTTGLKSYAVPLTIAAHIRHVISVSVTITGTRYFKEPNREALKMNTAPAIAKPFQNVYASLGTPQTWPKMYDITEVTPSADAGQDVYELRGVYKKPSNVDHILLDVDRTTFSPVLARWYYKNGSTIVMHIQETLHGTYRLPSHETVDVSFPQYSGSAAVDYGSYTLNEPIDESVFNG